MSMFLDIKMIQVFEDFIVNLIRGPRLTLFNLLNYGH